MTEQELILDAMKKALYIIIECAAVCCGVMLIIHRRVIAAGFTGEKMPEIPEWHKKLMCCGKKGGN